MPKALPLASRLTTHKIKRWSLCNDQDPYQTHLNEHECVLLCVPLQRIAHERVRIEVRLRSSSLHHHHHRHHSFIHSFNQTNHNIISHLKTNNNLCTFLFHSRFIFQFIVMSRFLAFFFSTHGNWEFNWTYDCSFFFYLFVLKIKSKKIYESE